MRKVLKRGNALFYWFFVLLVSGNCLFSEEASQTASVVNKKDDDVLATVGDVKITREKYNSELKNFDQKMRGGAGKIDPKQFLKEVIEVSLLEQEAYKQTPKDSPEFLKQVQEISVLLISDAYLQELMTEAMAKKETENPKSSGTPTKRFHLHQITLKTMDEAAKIKKEIEGGKSFIETAKSQSVDSFKDFGGDRGFVVIGDLSPSLASAVANLKENVISDPIPDGQDKFVIAKVSEVKLETDSESDGTETRKKTDQARRAAFEKIIADLKKEVGFKLEEENVPILQKMDLTQEEKNKDLFIVGSETVKVGEIAKEFESIPEFLRPQILSGEGLKDILNQFAARFTIKKYVEANFEKLSKKYPQVEAMAVREAAIKSFINQKMKSVDVSDEEIKGEYSKNLSRFTQPETSRAHHILVDSEEKAKGILERLTVKNEKFEDVAKAESKCPSGKNGGDLGSFEKGRMVPEFDEAVQKGEVGKIIGPVKTQFGFHIIRVDEKKPSRTLPLDEVKEQIRGELLPQKQKQTFDNLIEELKKKYPIQEFPERL